MQYYEYLDPSRFAGNEYANQTILHPVAVLAMAITLLILLFGGRRVWFLSLGVTICLLSVAQRVVVAGIDFPVLRILGFLGVVILAFRGEFKSLKISKLDVIMVSYFVLPAVLAPLRGQMGAVMMHTGHAADGITMYAIGRVAIRDLEDVRALAKSLVVISIPIVIAMSIEKATARNFFSILGGVPEITPVRFGKLRAQGAFPHAVIAGIWFASSIPIIFSLWPKGRKNGSGRLLAILGVTLAVIGAFATASSTSTAGALTAGLGLLAFRFWPLIKSARLLVVPLLIVIHFVIPGGIHGVLYTRFSFVTGSTGYHRFALVEGAIRNVGDWFFVGINNTYYWGWGMDDVTQEFVAAAIKGGIVGLALLVAILACSFKNAGVLMSRREPNVAFVGYCLGVSILVHLTCFLGASYFGQTDLLLYGTIGGMCTLAQNYAGAVLPRAAVYSGIDPRVGLGTTRR
jgi:hypothetical protein